MDPNSIEMDSVMVDKVESKKEGNWICCEVCGKKLLRRMANGVMVFKFGRNGQGEDVVHIRIFGSIQMQCIRDSCRHMNEFNFFP